VAFALLLPAAACAPDTAGDRRVADSGIQQGKQTSPAAQTPFNQAFWKIWGDGQAELASYDLVTNRYGKPRHGTAVAIFVTETFSDSLRVKADPGKHPASDQFPVMKLNLLRNYQTGIYDYSEMLSSFAALQAVEGRPAGSLTKASYSVQEWCGQQYAQVLFNRNSLKIDSHSYFDGEADFEGNLDYPENAVSEDSLMLWARGMAPPYLKAGETATLPILASLRAHLLDHRRLEWGNVKLSRLSLTVTVQTPAGNFATEAMSAEWPNDRKVTFYVERKPPFRVVQWESSSGEQAGLVKSTRAQYWKMNDPSGAAHLEELGLRPRPPRTM
jgi:hypothetical protein